MNKFVTKVPADKNKTQEESTLGPYVELMLDRNFKLFFASPKRKELLLAMLQEFLPEVGIVSIEIGPQERIGRDIHLTNSVFDVSCTTADGKSIVVEAQYNARKDYLDRMLYYSTWPIDEQIKRGKKEKNYFLKPIYILSFTNFALIHDDDWEAAGWDVERDGDKVVSSYTIREDSNGEKMTEALHFRYVELGRFNKKRNEIRSSRDRWLFYLKNLGKLKKVLPADTICSGKAATFPTQRNVWYKHECAHLAAPERASNPFPDDRRIGRVLCRYGCGFLPRRN